MFEESEIINLILGLVSLVIVCYEMRKREIPDFKLFVAGFLFVALARVFTVVEGLFFGNILNILEHVCYGLSAFMFGAGCVLLTRNRTPVSKG